MSEPVPQPLRLADALRNAVAAAMVAGIYAWLAGGLFHLVGPASAGAVAVGWGIGLAGAVALFLAVRSAVFLAGRFPGGALAPGLASRLASVVCLLAAAGAAPTLFRAADLAALAGAAAFTGAALALSLTGGVSDAAWRLLLPSRRIRDFLSAHPPLARRIEQHLGLLVTAGALLPWIAAASLFFLLPSGLRGVLAAYLLILAFLGYHLVRQLIEEVVVWSFLQALRAGRFARAAGLPLRAGRLAEEIRAAAPDLETPWAAFLTSVHEGLEGATLAPVEQARLRRAFLATYGSRALGSGLRVLGERQRQPQRGLRRWSEPEAASEASRGLVRRLAERGIRFRLETEASTELEPLELPAWRDLVREMWRPGRAGRVAWKALAARCPGESPARAAARLYPDSVRSALLPAALAWLPLLILTLAWVGRGPWAVPLVGAGLSFALLLWLTLFYGNWVFEESLRRGDFAYLARRLAAGVMRGELEDALGSRNPHVRERAVELLLFDDDIARAGVTPPPAGLRKFLRRAA